MNVHPFFVLKVNILASVAVLSETSVFLLHLFLSSIKQQSIVAIKRHHVFVAVGI